MAQILISYNWPNSLQFIACFVHFYVPILLYQKIYVLLLIYFAFELVELRLVEAGGKGNGGGMAGVKGKGKSLGNTSSLEDDPKKKLKALFCLFLNKIQIF